MKSRNKRVFLDYASTTPVSKGVLKAMQPYWSSDFANPSTYYQEGLCANTALESVRQDVASLLSVKPQEIIFTGSGTEADNLAIFGLLKGIKESEHKLFDWWKKQKLQVVTTVIEHPAILESCSEVEKQSLADVVYLPVTESGKVNTSQIQNYLTPETVLVSVILANNEIGTIQSLRDISGEIKKYKNKLNRSFNEPPYLHTDASQAPLWLDINLDKLGVHMMTLDSSKIYGPKGVACLVRKSYIPMSPIMFGGGQEFCLRPGTENVPLIVGFAKALNIAQQNFSQNFKKVKTLQEYFYQKLEQKIPQAQINGSKKDRLPNNVNFCIPGLNSEFAVIQLDERGVACSAMTACKGADTEARSYVVDALYNKGADLDCGKSSLRFTFGLDTTKRDIDFAIIALSDII